MRYPEVDINAHSNSGIQIICEKLEKADVKDVFREWQWTQFAAAAPFNPSTANPDRIPSGCSQ